MSARPPSHAKLLWFCAPPPSMCDAFSLCEAIAITPQSSSFLLCFAEYPYLFAGLYHKDGTSVHTRGWTLFTLFTGSILSQ
ncbi:putative beta-glucosidase 47 isoform X1 [Sesbania bispinosa]|nr:putative beta-glucosidase 47 isoform X1 [Sesbania bispinosa]